ncbi:MAG: DUF6777 domain-containing protein [Actinomycetota bacterium]
MPGTGAPPPVPSAGRQPGGSNAPATRMSATSQPGPAAQRPRWLPAAVVIGAAAALLIGFLAFSGNDDAPSAAAGTSTVPVLTSAAIATVPATISGIPGEIFREPRTATGPDPFTPSIDNTPPLTTGPEGRVTPQTPFPGDSVPPPTAPGEVETIPGNAPGLYGGTRDRASCDAAKLVDFLEANADKASAWAAVQQIQPADIRTFVATLTPVILRTDTRVTNYGFNNGRAPDRQVVLEAGTAVMIDGLGIPRVRCFCGNPLRPPNPEPTPTYTGDSWEGFDPGQVTVISESPVPVDDFTLVDVETGAPFDRPAGTSGDTDVDSDDEFLGPGTTAVASTTVVATTVVETTVAPPPTEVTSLGQIGATTTYDDLPQYQPDKAVDGDRTTSWFSAGPDPGQGFTFFGWQAASDLRIDGVDIFGNGTNGDLSVRQGFGFASVRIVILDSENQAVFDQTVDLGGTPDPDVRVSPHVVGSVVQLFFSGAEDPACGGFTELVITGAPLLA